MAKKKAKKKRTNPLAKLMYDLRPELAAIVGKKVESRPQMMKAIWIYIKKHKLQGFEGDNRMIVPDEKMAKVFGKKPFNMFKIAGGISNFINQVKKK